MKKKLNILILEDFPDDVKLIERELQKADFNFVSKSVNNKKDFQRGLKNFKPDLILSDYSLPQFTGMEALEIVKNISSETPFIIVTGSLSEEIAVECMQKGAWEYVIKENLIRLVPAVKNVLALKKQYDKRQQAEKKLQHERDLFQNFIDALPDSIFFKDQKHHFLRVNAAKAREQNTTPQKMIGKSDFDYFPEEIAQNAYNDDKYILNTGKQILSKEEKIVHPDGSEHWVSVTKLPHKDNKGNILGTMGIARDITKQKMAELALKERIKELTCLNRITEISNRQDVNFEDLYMETVNLISANWQYPKICGSRISIEGKVYKTNNFQETKWMQSAEIWKKNENVGTIEVSYTEERKKEYEGPFLMEERELLNHIAQILGAKMEREYAENLLIIKEKKYRSIFENTGTATVIFDDDGLITICNQKFAELTGYSKEEIENKKKWTEFVAPYHLKRMQLYNQQRHEKNSNPPSKYEFNLIDKNGKTKNIDLNISNLPDNKNYIASLNDITNLKKTEINLRHRVEMEKLVAQISSRLINVNHINLDKVITVSLEKLCGSLFIDRGCIYLLDDDKEVAIRKYEWQSENINPFSNDFRKTTVDKSPWGKEKIARLETIKIVSLKDIPEESHILKEILKKQQIKSLLVIPMKYNKNIIGAVSFENLKEEKHWSEEDISLLKTVVHMFSNAFAYKQEINEKEVIRKQLEQAQKMEAIGNLAGGVAHDFNNILTIMQGQAQFMKMKLNEDNPLMKRIDPILKASERAQRLTRQLLLFSRKEDICLQPTMLNKNIENLIKMLGRLIGEDISIKIELAPDLWKISADEGNMEQIIMNLTINARDAMPDGGEIIIKTENVKINKNEARKNHKSYEGDFVCLSIEDCGEGIEEEVLEKIFEPFFTTKEKGQGTGLGLSTVYGIVNEHRGWINVSSSVGKGTIFKIYFPALFKEVKLDKTQNIELSDLSGNGYRILLVEDEIDILQLADMLLSDAGYIVKKAESAEVAIKIFNEENGNFDLLLSDVVLPKKSGLELADYLTSIKPNLNIILSSGYTAKKANPQLIREKGYNFVRKPFKIEKLLNEVKKTIQHE